MTAADFAALLRYLHAGPKASVYALAHLATRINERNLRAMAEGRTAVPPTVAAYIVGRAALRLTLKGWGSEIPPVSAEIAAEIKNRLEEARRHAEKTR